MIKAAPICNDVMFQLWDEQRAKAVRAQNRLAMVAIIAFALGIFVGGAIQL